MPVVKGIIVPIKKYLDYTQQKTHSDWSGYENFIGYYMYPPYFSIFIN